jgi:signal transduction histidine kinase
MTNMRLQTQLLLTAISVIVLMTSAALFIAQRTVKSELRRQEQESVAASLTAFKSVKQVRERQLSRTAALLAELPTLKALVTTEHPPTVQDGSEPFWKLSASDLFVLASPDTSILAVHVSRGGWTAETAQAHLQNALDRQQWSGWWADHGRLYWTFLRPITTGAGAETRDIGLIAIGYEVNASIAQELARASRAEIILTTGQQVLASTLSDDEAQPFAREFLRISSSKEENWRQQAVLGGKTYSAASVALSDESVPPIRCFVLTSFEASNSFLKRLDHVLLGVALLSFAMAALLVHLISGAVTRPLEIVISGIEALARGNYGYTVQVSGGREVERLGESFSSMRERLLESQRNMIAAERIAALDQSASSISHDLRHYLAAVVANAEFLYEADQLKLDKGEIYREIKIATDQMLDLIESMRELSRAHPVLSLNPGNLADTVRRAVETVDARQQFRNAQIRILGASELPGSFDSKKLERVFFNLVLNACEAAVQHRDPDITIQLHATEESFEVRLSDNGQGVPEDIRDRMFDPFVSYGKNNGTGLGLTIANKVVQEHGGSLTVERTGPDGTTMLVRLPRWTRQSLVMATSV